MSGLTVLLIVIAVIVFTIIMLCFVLPALKRRGINVEAALDSTKDAISTVCKTLETIRPFLPASPGLALFDKILAAASVGVKNAEQLFHVGQLEGDKRKEEAEAYIKSVLTLAGVEITPEVEKLIDGAIEAEVLNLGHAVELIEARIGLDLPEPDGGTTAQPLN